MTKGISKNAEIMIVLKKVSVECLPLLVCLAVSASQAIANDMAEFQTKVHQISEKYHNKELEDCFERAFVSPKNFVVRIRDYLLTDHSSQYQADIRTGLHTARDGDWKQTEVYLKKALSRMPDLPDLILLKAVAERKNDDFKSALTDFEYLCQLLEERKDGRSRATNDLLDPLPAGLSADRKQKLTADRVQIYELNWNSYTEALSNYGVDVKRFGSR